MFFKLPWFGKAKKDHYHDTQVLELDFLVDEFTTPWPTSRTRSAPACTRP